ncbi:MAG: hypothetical protein ACJ8EL_14510 [Rhizomicrobium sp.]
MRILFAALRCASIVCVVSLALAGPAAAKPSYTKIKFQHSTPTAVNVINNVGAVAGQYGNGSTRAFVRAPDGSFTAFSVEGAVVTIPRGFSDDGAVGGRYDLPDDTIHGFLRDPAGNITAFDGPGLGAAEINGMNGSHEIAGTYFISEDQTLGGFILHENGTFTRFQIDEARPGGLTVAGIDAAGGVAGNYTDANFVHHGFVRTAKGKLIALDAPGAGDAFGEGTNVLAVNDKGWIAGSYTDAQDATHFYLRKSGGDFDTLDMPPSFRMAAMNNVGEITGCFTSNFRNHGFVRRPRGKLVTFDLPWGDSEDMCAEDINELGQVAGHVRYGAFGETEFGFIRSP